MQSHRVVWTQPGVAQVEPFEAPEPKADEVLIRTRLSLISPGTERAFFLGLPNAQASFPQFPGYSITGEVAQIGAQVEHLKVGDRVAADANHGGLVVVQAAKCVRVPDNVADEDAVFFMLGAIALQAIRKARIEVGESVVVVGAGMIGVLASQLSKLAGGAPVVCVDRDEQRLAFAKAAGVDAAIVADENVSQAIESRCGVGGAHVVIEATGNPAAIVSAFALARNAGRVVLLGSTRGETEQVNFYRDVHKKGLTVIGAHNSARPQSESTAAWWTLHDDQEVMLKLLSMQRLSVQPLITNRFTWQQAPEAYNLLAKAEGSTQAMLLNWQDS